MNSRKKFSSDFYSLTCKLQFEKHFLSPSFSLRKLAIFSKVTLCFFVSLGTLSDDFIS